MDERMAAMAGDSPGGAGPAEHSEASMTKAPADEARRAPPEVQRAEVAGDMRYYFSIDAALRLASSSPPDVRNPRGARLQVVVQNGRVFTMAEKYERSWQARPIDFLQLRGAEPAAPGDEVMLTHAREILQGEQRNKEVASLADAHARSWNGLDGEILGGGDFFLVRSDGVLELDGRVTIRALPDGTLIDAVYTGLVDLTRIASGQPLEELRREMRFRDRQRETEARVSLVFEDFINGRLNVRPQYVGDDRRLRLPVRVSGRFELATGPWSTMEGEDTTWVKDRYLRLQKHVWRYEVLTREQFTSEGNMYFDPFTPGQLPSPRRIELDVYGCRGEV